MHWTKKELIPFQEKMNSLLVHPFKPQQGIRASLTVNTLQFSSVQQVRNQLDSSAPARKRGKEREGGKKKKTSSMKKIILAEKARKLAERQEAAARREKRIKDGVRLEPLPQTEFRKA